MDKEIPQLILSYATRINAEQAVMRGKLFKDKRLQISWAPVVSSTAANPGAFITDKSANQDAKSNTLEPIKLVTSPNTSDKHINDSEITGETLPELRLEDEEEDEESEDRSWRR
ncbi:zinc finger protein swm-like [Rhagoletis pomonella]|nr:zinc finger protein swm-like [Rhagoletis pomonella]